MKIPGSETERVIQRKTWDHITKPLYKLKKWHSMNPQVVQTKTKVLHGGIKYTVMQTVVYPTRHRHQKK